MKNEMKNELNISELNISELNIEMKQELKIEC